MTVKPDEILRDNFAPWVLDLGLVPEEVGDGTAVLRLPWNDRLAREGGALSGQALMAAADTAVVLAVSGAKGGFVPMTTVQLNTSFQRPVVGKDVLVRVELSKLGRSLAFAEIDMTVDSATVAHASAVYAIIG
ncbi:PaaI family thioesterase [Actinomadura bangladeshensis]|uniref:PaaI family thioesterase n=1 Tax=Actinomadura bangladeshensis TaxID=453573 RepID=A0A6L9Q978_9ACTN|nr:PaaI family thioesterase [Actinomadura bangladeshensis]NEA21745.1 PaaI family thioesterase [Actinomadura bangladeshensis]